MKRFHRPWVDPYIPLIGKRVVRRPRVVTFRRRRFITPKRRMKAANTGVLSQLKVVKRMTTTHGGKRSDEEKVACLARGQVQRAAEDAVASEGTINGEVLLPCDLRFRPPLLARGWG